MNDLVAVVLAGVVTMLATGLGVIPVRLLGPRADRWRPFLLGTAIGAMTLAAAIGLIAPGLDLGDPLEVWGGVVLGAVLFFVIRRALRTHEYELAQAGGADLRRAMLVFAVLFVHSLPEGFAVGTAFASPERDVGLFVILAIALQNVPEGTSVAIPMEDAGIGFWRQFWAAVATSAPQPVGALIAYLLVDSVDGLLPISFGFAAGAMLLLVAVEMVPDGFARGTRTMAAAGTAAGAVGILVLESIVV